MRRTIVGPDGTLALGDAAERLGFVAGAPVEIIVTSAGSLLVCLDRDSMAYDAAWKQLVGGAAQLAARNARRERG